MSSYRFRADGFYPWLVFGTVASTIVLAWWQVAPLIPGLGFEGEEPEQIRSLLVTALSYTAFFTLAWRFWFAWRYRPHAAVADSDLPSISVVIPAYNEGEQILLTVRSVMASHYPSAKMQVICVDDGSQDDTWRWMLLARMEFARRVRLIKQPVNRGKRHALMAGFTVATGDVYVTIDSDSEVLPDTLRHLVSPFCHDARVGAVAGNVRVLNIAEGKIPKMMEVSFTNAFDFLRSAQSVYGGVFCTPGALSAYRAAVISPHLPNWADQTFMGIPAAIGEDRALTNLVLGCGYRVIYQRKAVVLTKMPVTFGGLRRMLLRWARSNVRENLVMVRFLVKRFRTGHNGSGWIRLFSATQLFQMALGEAFKFGVLIQLCLAPFATFRVLVIGCFIGAILPALVHQWRYGGWFGWQWAIPYSFFWVFGLSWISLWGLLTASRSSWLTRGPVPAKAGAVAALASSQPPKVFSRAA